MFLSFIIPVYNCEKLITRCVKSILEQDFDDLEIILVNDGSLDDSFDVCNKLADTYKNITVLTQSNKGASSARNHGLSIAKGDYVWFVDADDYITPGIVKTIYKHVIDKSCDVFAMNYKYITNSSQKDILQYTKDTDVSCVDYLSDAPCMFAATKVYKRSSLKGQTFRDGLTNIEDFLFNIQYLATIDSIHILPNVGYVYDNTNINSTSQNRSKRNLIKLTNQSLIVHEAIYNQLQRMPDSDVQIAVSKQLNYSILGHLYSLVRFYNSKRLSKVIKWYEEKGLYPIGDTGKKRSNRVLRLFNNRKLLLFVSNAYKLLK